MRLQGTGSSRELHLGHMGQRDASRLLDRHQSYQACAEDSAEPVPATEEHCIFRQMIRTPRFAVRIGCRLRQQELADLLHKESKPGCSGLEGQAPKAEASRQRSMTYCSLVSAAHCRAGATPVGTVLYKTEVAN